MVTMGTTREDASLTTMAQNVQRRQGLREEVPAMSEVYFSVEHAEH